MKIIKAWITILWEKFWNKYSYGMILFRDQIFWSG